MRMIWELKYSTSAVFYNKTDSKMDIIIDFPIYDLYGNMVE